MKKNATDFKVKNQRVIIRCDLNVPIENGVITDDTRIKASAMPIIINDFKFFLKHIIFPLSFNNNNLCLY